MPVPARLAVLLAALALVAGCTSDDRPSPPQGGASGQKPAAPPAKLDLKITAQAIGVPRGANAPAEARKATPGVERFLTTYLQAAALDPNQHKTGYRDLLALFDPPVQKAARRDLAALSLSGVKDLKTVRPQRASASVLLLYRGDAPAAATVRLNFDGSAEVAQGTGPVRLVSVFQLLATSKGWRIASYSSRTGADR